MLCVEGGNSDFRELGGEVAVVREQWPRNDFLNPWAAIRVHQGVVESFDKLCWGGVASLFGYQEQDLY